MAIARRRGQESNGVKKVNNALCALHIIVSKISTHRPPSRISPSSSNSKQSKLRYSDDEDPSSIPQPQLNHPFLRRCTCSDNFFKKELPVHGLASNLNLRWKRY
ncbi:unnamed protein product [Prunus armeniaca]